MYSISNSIKFKTYISEATEKIHQNEFKESYKIIMKALSENPNAPEPHNLLGIWYELKKNDDLARKHYRAAYALDPTYTPASENLERITTYHTAFHKPLGFDFGESEKHE